MRNIWPYIRPILSKRIWRFPLWAYLVVGLLVVAGASGGENVDARADSSDQAEQSEAADAVSVDADEDKLDVDAEASDQPAVRAFGELDWVDEVAFIASSDDSPIARLDAIASLAKSYSLSETDIDEQSAYLVEQIRSRSIVERSQESTYIHQVAFVARSIDLAIEDDSGRPEKDFAFDAWQIARDLARGTEEPDSDFIQANLEQLDEAIAENGWARVEIYAYDLISSEDKPFAGVSRIADFIAINDPDVTSARLRATLDEHIEQYRGTASAVSVNVKSDPREPAPGAYGVYHWAPGGEWGDAIDGDPATWDGYEWKALIAPDKLDGAACERPTEQAFEVAELFWSEESLETELASEDPLEAEEATIAQIAGGMGLEVPTVRQMLLSMSVWQYC